MNFQIIGSESIGGKSRTYLIFLQFGVLGQPALKGFTQVLISFTYYQRKGSIQPLPEGQRYNLPLDPSAMKHYKNRNINMNCRQGMESLFLLLMMKTKFVRLLKKYWKHMDIG